VLTRAERVGSLDSNIHGEEFNDFNKIFNDFPKLRIVFFNGKKAAEYFKGFNSIPKDKEYYILPSTSSANTWKTFDQKCKEWKEVFEITMANRDS
jgi:hypoxanthine-DNA glycosylase